jgi:hypothetical protein
VTKYPSFPLYPKDFLGDPKVLRMSDAEVGFYFRMLCHEWLEVGIPLTSPVVREWWSKGGTVAECFFEREGRLFNPRLEKEREKKRLWSEKSSTGGRVGAEIKRLNVQLKGGTLDGVPPLKAKPHKREQKLLYKGDYQKTSEVFAQIIGEWNTLAIKHSLSPLNDIIPGSARAKNTIYLLSLEDFDFASLVKVIGASPFLIGESKTGWKVSYDWAIKIDNYMKIMEGNYKGGTEGEPEKTWDDFVAGKGKPENPFDF